MCGSERQKRKRSVGEKSLKLTRARPFYLVMNAAHIIRIALSLLLLSGGVMFLSTESELKAETVKVVKSAGVCKIGSSC